jgi:hypothetical protein
MQPCFQTRIFVVSRLHRPLQARQRHRVVAVCAGRLRGSNELRSLAPSQPAGHANDESHPRIVV